MFRTTFNLALALPLGATRIAAALGVTLAIAAAPSGAQTANGAGSWGTAPAPAAPLHSSKRVPPQASTLPTLRATPSAFAASAAAPALAGDARPSTRLATSAPDRGGSAQRLSDLLALPNDRQVPTSDGGFTTAGEVKRRYAEWMNDELSRRKPAAALHVSRAARVATARVNGVTQAPGSAMRSMDAALVGELRRVRPLPEGAKSSPARFIDPCQVAIVDGGEHSLSSVNQRGKDFWINLDSDERVLVLGGCFDPKRGTVRVHGNFPGGHVEAQVLLWEERVIVAQVPMLSGVTDQDISVRVVFGNGQSTNERRGHLWARREIRTLDDLKLYASSGDCPARSAGGARGPTLVVMVPPKYPLGTSTPFLDNRSSTLKEGTCTLAQGAVAPQGVTHFKARLAPGWEVIDLSLDPFLGNARHEWVGDTDFDVHWTAATFTATHRLFGAPTGTELFFALGFNVDQVKVRGPAGTSPFAK